MTGHGLSRRTLLAGGLGVGAMGLAACGGPAPGQAASSANASSESGELTVVTPIFEGNDGKALMEKLIGEFQGKYPNITVRPDYASYSNLNEKLTTSIAGGRPYDVMIMGVGWIPPFATKNVLADLGMSADSLKSTFNARVLEPAAYQGKLYALPIMLDTRFGYYRKDHFAEVGLDPNSPPKTFAQIREFAKKLTKREGGKLTRAGFDFLTVDLRQAYETLLWAAGGDLYGTDGKPAFNSTQGVNALQFMTDIIQTDKSLDVGFSDPGAATGIPLAQGRASMMLGHNNNWIQFQATAKDLLDNDRIGMFIMTDQRPAMFQGGSMATVSARTKLPGAAKAFAQFLAEPQPALQASAQRGNVPAVTSAMDSDYVKGNKAVQFAMQNFDACFSEGGTANWLDVRGSFKASIESALLGRATPKAALDDLAAKASK